jgi:PTK7 protein tyrosine kinase 7
MFDVEKCDNPEVQEEQCELRETSVKANSTHSATKKKKKENRESHQSDGTDTAHSVNSNHSRKSKSSYDKLAVSRSLLHDMKPLGRGEFGEVFSCKYRPISSGEDGPIKESVVMVKTLNNTKDETVLQDMKRHLDLLHKLNHENIAKLIGLCREEDPDYMIIEYTDWGDLKQFLLASRVKDNAANAESSKPRAPQLAVAQILSLANQVS